MRPPFSSRSRKKLLCAAAMLVSIMLMWCVATWRIYQAITTANNQRSLLSTHAVHEHWSGVPKQSEYWLDLSQSLLHPVGFHHSVDKEVSCDVQSLSALRSRWLSPWNKDWHKEGKPASVPSSCARTPAIGPFDVVITFVNGSTDNFRELWEAAAATQEAAMLRDKSVQRQEAKAQESIAFLIRRLEAVVAKNDELESRRALALIDSLKASITQRKFSSSRFTDWGEIEFAAASIAACYKRQQNDVASADSHRLEQMPLPLSGIVHVVVGDETQTPHFLHQYRRTVVRRVNGCGRAAEYSEFIDDESNVTFRVHFHDALNDDDALRNCSANLMFNSNAIESLLHRISGLSEHFLYFNNDMMWGRCPRIADYLQPVDVSHSVLMLAPVVIGETFTEQKKFSATSAPPTLHESSVDHLFIEHQETILSHILASTEDDKERRRIPPPKCERPSFSFAHYPRLMSKRLLQLLMDSRESPLFEAVERTRRHIAFRTSSDVWVPFLTERLTAALLAETCATLSCSEIVAAVRGHEDYLFVMLDSRARIVKTLSSIVQRRHDDAQSAYGNHSRDMPLFVTLNDNFDAFFKSEEYPAPGQKMQIDNTLRRPPTSPSAGHQNIRRSMRLLMLELTRKES